MDAVETAEHHGFDIEIYYEDSPESPREWDNLCEFHCSHSRYSLGDTQYPTGEDCVREANKAKRQGDMVLPLYLYDHSGITISLAPFSCPWDSGQVGFVIIRRKKMIEEFSAKIFHKALRENARKHAESEVKTYDQYLRGEVYGFIVKEDGECKDSCWGYYSIEDAITAAKEDCEAEDEIVRQHREKQQPFLFAVN